MTSRGLPSDRLIAALPAAHRTFLERALPLLAADERLIGVAAGGSLVLGTTDAFSDLDLVIGVEPAAYEAVLADRKPLAAQLGRLLSAFTGEHVGEPRLLICLYDEPLLHVDLKFVSEERLAERVEQPLILWQRGARLSEAFAHGTARYPAPDLQWIEDRFWTWVHYVAMKLARGELFEAIDATSVMRAWVLGPLSLARAGARPQGVRRIEFSAPEAVEPLKATLATYDRESARAALHATVLAYRALRDALATDDLRRGTDAEAAAVRVLAELSFAT